jgi:hypothetical protein
MKHWNFCVFYDWYWMILKSATSARNVSRMWLTLATVQLHGIAWHCIFRVGAWIIY